MEALLISVFVVVAIASYRVGNWAVGRSDSIIIFLGLAASLIGTPLFGGIPYLVGYVRAKRRRDLETEST